MDYYDKKQKMYHTVDNIVKRSMPEGIEKSDLVYTVMKRTGFSEKLIEKYIDMTIQKSVFKKQGEMIKWAN